MYSVGSQEMAFPKSSKTSRSWTLESMRQALQAVDGGMSIRSSAELFGIPRNTLTSYVASELRPDDEMKFMENFDPEKSKREQRKLSRKISNVTKRSTVYDDKGLHLKTGRDLCDCLNANCEGCFFSCPKCRSFKCGQECRQNRRWMYESYHVQGTDKVVNNQYLDR
uniref:ARF7 effector protein C-terminal domain-containing protein n=1 Tax=Cuerna arida TaxID=1464854 RepID=A0A1B6G6T2_9HEMI